NGETDGTIRLNITGNTGAVTTTWNDPSLNGQTEIVGSLAPGNYAATLTDASGCNFLVGPLTVAEPDSLLISCSVLSNASASNVADGTAEIVVTGGVGPYDLLVSGPTSIARTDEAGDTINLNLLLPGDYSVMLSDDNGCISDCSFTVGGNQDLSCQMTLGDETGTNVTCFGGDDGTINIQVSDTIGPVTVEWSPNAVFDENDLLTALNDSFSVMVPAGEYSYRITDLGSNEVCFRIRGGIIRTQPDSMTLECGELLQASSATAADGTATFVVGGGNDFAGYTLEITGPVDTMHTGFGPGIVDVAGLLPGDYVVLLRDGLGCVSESCNFTITFPLSCNLMVDSIVTPISCFNVTDGAISLLVSGNNEPLTYTWSDPTLPMDSALTDLAPGIYTVTIAESASCQRELSFTLAAPSEIMLLCSLANEASGPNITDGVAAVTYLGGTAPYEIRIEGGMIADTLRNIPAAGDTTFRNLPTGVYLIEITDANGCVDICFVTVTSVGCTLMANAEVEGVSCSGDTDGTIRLNISGNTGGVFIDWDDPTYDGQSQLIDILPPGDYSATITDASGCTLPIGPINVSEPAALSLECNVLNDVSAPNAADGAAEGIITGGTGPFQFITRRFITPTFSINDTIIVASADTVIRTGLSGGTNPPTSYEFVVVDANGCRTSCPFSIFEPGCPPIFADESVTTVGCTGDSTGRIELTVPNATPPIEYIWTYVDDPTLVLPDSNVIDNLPAGVYQYVLIDANSCTDARQITILEPASRPTLDCRALTDETSAGAANGSAEIQVMGGTPPYQLTLSGAEDRMISIAAAGTDTIMNLAAGDYLLVITDDSGCSTDTCSFTIGQGVCALSATAVISPASCVGLGQVDLTVLNNQGLPTFDWNVDSLDGREDVNLASGVYSVIVTDPQGCADTLSIEVPSLDDSNFITAAVAVFGADCSSNGAADVTVTGSAMPPFDFNWSVDSLDGMEDVLLASGSYQLTVSNAEGCADTIAVDVPLIDNAPTISLNAASTVCAGDDINILLSFTGVSPFTVTFTSVVTGPQSLTITSLDTLIMIPTDPSLGSELAITLLSVTDGRGCDTTVNSTRLFTINYPDTIRNFGTFCADQIVEIGGRTFSVTNPSDTFTVFTGDGCGELYEVNVDFIEPSIDTLSRTLCPGVPTEILGVIFDGNNTEALIDIDEPTVAGCDSLVFVTVDFFPPSQGAITLNACRGDTIREFGREFTFQDNSGVVVLPGASVNGCDSLLAVTVNFGEAPSVRLVGSDAICLGESSVLQFEVAGNGSVDVTLTDSDGNIQLINGVSNGDEIAVTPMFTTTYSITAANSVSPCPVQFSGTATVSVSRLSGELLSTIEQDSFQISCHGANDGRLSVVINEGLPPFDFTWSTGQTTAEISNLSPGNYAVTVVDAAGCTETFAAFLQEPPPLAFGVSALAPDCNTELGRVLIDTVLGGVGPFEISTDGNIFRVVNTFPYLESLAPGNYTISLQDAAGCTATTELLVPPPLDAQLFLTEDTTIFLGDSVLLMAQTDLAVDTVVWSPTNGLSQPNEPTTFAAPTNTTIYTVVLRDSSGCDVMGEVEVIVDRRARVYVPNIFSPNSDGSNDLFRVFPGPGVERIRILQIFDRWGDMVYEATDFDPFNPTIGWDGTLGGEPMNPAVFVWQLEASLEDGRIIYLKGDVVLRR
ncbi:MAG: gliding motility-associated C-terminal domain-containing protein, partial [Bacteroidota bacterium]